MDSSRRQRLTAMGLTDWQLRFAERLAMTPLAAPAQPRLWIKGPVPAWVADLCRALGLTPQGWSPWQEGADPAWSLCTEMVADAACALHCPLPADGAAKRRLWQAWCQQHA
ncbi:MAG: DNA polymerase III subunit psi [Aeromonadaceae bacterium]|nr:DNA polymerase III subunit psi [Aeromonadaceae bacterium]